MLFFITLVIIITLVVLFNYMCIKSNGAPAYVQETKILVPMENF